MQNADAETVASFGEEWSKFTHDAPNAVTQSLFDRYFGVFPWESLPQDASGFDAGCGSGRWSRFVAPKVGQLHLVDASKEALSVAQQNLSDHPNCAFHHASVADLPFAEASMDFGFSLGVLHHTPDIQAGLSHCVSKLKPGAPFLLYLYYALDNRPPLFRGIWQLSNQLRKTVSRLPEPIKGPVCEGLAAGVYFPLAKGAKLVERFGVNVRHIPLSDYRNTDFLTMRNDARDRFGTPVEHRVTRQEMQAMMEKAGLENIRFSEAVPFWTAVGFRGTHRQTP